MRDRNSIFKRRRLAIEDCEERLLLTNGCPADATEPISAQESVAEVASQFEVREPDATKIVTDDEVVSKLKGAANVTHETSVEPAVRVSVETTVELVVPHDDVYELGIEQAGDPTADEGPT